MTADNKLDSVGNRGNQLTFQAQNKWIDHRMPNVSAANRISTHLVHKSKDSVSWGFGSKEASRSNSLADTGSGIV